MVKITSARLSYSCILNKQCFTLNHISFGSNTDCFQLKPGSLFGNLSPDEVSSAMDIVKNSPRKDNGYTCDIHQYKNYAIKSVSKNSKQPPPDKTFKTEFSALKYAEKAGVSDAQKAIDIITDGDRYYLVTDFIKGIHPNPLNENAKLTTNHLKDMLQKLTQLDQSGLLHYDLQLKNYFIDGDKVRLIDFGSFAFLDPSIKNYADNIKIDNNAITNISKFYNVFKPNFLKKWDYNQQLSDNPYFKIKSNIANFEHRSLHYYLSKMANNGENGQEKAKELFKQYLSLKAEHYHKPMAQFLESFDPQKIQEVSGLSAKESSEILTKAIEHEKNTAKLLASPSDDIVKVELSKMQLRYSLKEGEGFKQVCDDFGKIMDSVEKNASKELKKYINSSRKFLGMFEFLKENPAKLAEVLPENNDILKLLFKNVEKIVDKTTNATIDKAKKNNSKIFGAITAGFALIGGILYYFRNKIKNNKPIVQPPDIAQQQNYQPQIYSQSKQNTNTNPFFVKNNYNVNNEIFKKIKKA